MDGPERLDVGEPRQGRRTSYLWVGALALVLAGLAAVHYGVLVPDSTSTPPIRSSSSPLPTSTTWPVASLPSGTLYVLAQTGVYAVDVGSGLVTSAQRSVDTSASVLTPMSYGVLMWSPEGGSQSLVIPGQRSSPELGSEIRSANAFLPGPDGSVWAATLDRRDLTAKSTWRLVDDGNHVQATVSARGFVRTDGAGGLFALDVSTLRHVYPGPVERLDDTDLASVGPDGYELRHCRHGECASRLRDRSIGSDTALSVATPPGFAAGALSAGNRFVAYESAIGNKVEVRVGRTGSGEWLRAFPTGDYATAFTWLSDRWLVATSGDGLVLYDAVADRAVIPALPIDGPAQLVWRAG